MPLCEWSAKREVLTTALRPVSILLIGERFMHLAFRYQTEFDLPNIEIRKQWEEMLKRQPRSQKNNIVVFTAPMKQLELDFPKNPILITF